MFHVYFLYSKTKNNIYVGCTKNLKQRLKEHESGLVISTKYKRPLKCIYTEEYKSLSIARRREDYLKSLYGYRERKRIINEYLNKV